MSGWAQVVCVCVCVTGCIESNPQPSPGTPDGTIAGAKDTMSAVDAGGADRAIGAVDAVDANEPPPADIVADGGEDAVCAPNCLEKNCGDDGCGGSCGDCPGGEFCSDGTCLPDACDPCELWSTGPYCTPTQPCAVDSDCPATASNYAYTCEAGTCVFHVNDCQNDAQCLEWCLQTAADPADCEKMVHVCQITEFCGESMAFCIQHTPCNTTTDCPAPDFLMAYVCEDGLCQSQVRPCASDAQCLQWCQESAYGPLGTCETTILECRPLPCMPGVNQCVMLTLGTCVSDADCLPDNYAQTYQCVDGYCEGELRHCSSDQQCLGWCQDMYPTSPEVCDNMHLKCLD